MRASADRKKWLVLLSRGMSHGPGKRGLFHALPEGKCAWMHSCSIPSGVWCLVTADRAPPRLRTKLHRAAKGSVIPLGTLDNPFGAAPFIAGTLVHAEENLAFCSQLSHVSTQWCAQHLARSLRSQRTLPPISCQSAPRKAKGARNFALGLRLRA